MRPAIASSSSSLARLKYVRSVSKMPAVVSEPEIPEKPTLSHSSEDPNPETGFPKKIGPNFSFFPGNSSSTGTGYAQNSIPTSGILQGTAVHSEKEAVDALFSRADDPHSALEWVRKQHGFAGGVEVHCALICILMRSPETLWRARELITECISACSSPSPAVFVDRLINWAERFDFLQKDEVFECLLGCYIKSRPIEQAIECFDSMIRGDVIPRVPCMNRFLGALVRGGMIDELRDCNAKLIKKGAYGDSLTVRVICRALSKEWKAKEAEKYLGELKRRGVELDARAYDSVIQTVCRKPHSKLGIRLLEDMKERGWVPSEAAFSRVIAVCAAEGNMAEATRVKDEMMSSGKRPMNLASATSLIKGYFAQGDSDSALNLYSKVIEDGLVPDRLMYSVLIIGCTKSGNVEKASELYAQMKLEGIVPKAIDVNCVLWGYLKKASLREEASKLFDEAVDSGLANSYTYFAMISQLRREGKMDEACRLWDGMTSRGLVPDLYTHNVMIYGHCQNGNMHMALSIFSDMLERGLKPNDYTYSRLIYGHFEKYEKEKALKLFDEMTSSGVVPARYTQEAMIEGLCYVGCTSEARDAMKKFGFVPCTYTLNCFIFDYCLDGDMDMASGVFSEMLERCLKPDAYTYTYLIFGHFNSGDRAKALGLFDEMKSSGIAPIDFTYNEIVEGLSKLGYLSEAREAMKKFMATGYVPSESALECIVDEFLHARETNSALGVELGFGPARPKPEPELEPEPVSAQQISAAVQNGSSFLEPFLFGPLIVKPNPTLRRAWDPTMKTEKKYFF